MKKLLTVLLAMLLTASCFTFSSFAAGSLKITAVASEAKAGEDVSLTLTLSSVPTGNVNLVHFKVTYDNSIFTLNGVKNKEVKPVSSNIPSDIELTAIADGNTIDVYLINWGKIEGTGKSVLASSQNIVFSFSVKSGTGGKDYTFSVSGTEYGLDSDVLPAKRTSGTSENATGKVTEKEEFERGDLNSDGSKNTNDAIYLLRHIMRASKYPIEQSGDMDGDGSKNTADALYLLRHIMRPAKYPLAN